MNGLHADRCRFPPTLWRAIRRAGLEPAVVLRSAGLPVTIHLDPARSLSTAQLFAIWKAVEALSKSPAFALRIVEAADEAGHQPAFIAALYASSFRDAISRIVRFKRLGACERFWTREEAGLWSIGKDWPHAGEPEPAVSIDLSFAFLLELGRRGTGRRIAPVGIEYAGGRPHGEALESYFGCPIRSGALQNVMTFAAADLDLPFPGHSPEFLELVTPGLAAAFAEIEAGATNSERVKAVLKRALASGRPEIGAIASDLGMSERTLQRRITEEATTFRALLVEARRELGLQLLADPKIELDEVTYMLGYQDRTSFYRAFKEWEGVSPGAWRASRANGAGHPAPSAR